MGALQDTFVQKAKAGDVGSAADLLNGMAMPDILASLASLGPEGPVICDRIVAQLRARGWLPSAERIAFAGSVVAQKAVPNPPPAGLPPEQVADAQKFLSTAAGGGKGRNADGKFTSDTKEQPIVQTVITAASVYNLVKPEWPKLSDVGARIITAQALFETGGGVNCYNWNIGGTKAKDGQSHFYMTTMECWPKPQWDAELKSGAGRLPTQPEKVKYDACPGGTFLIMYDPPNHFSRFVSHASLRSSIHAYVGHHQYINSQQPGYFEALDEGSIPKAVQFLRAYKYFTGDPAVYQRGMEAKKAIVDQEVK